VFGIKVRRFTTKWRIGLVLAMLLLRRCPATELRDLKVLYVGNPTSARAAAPDGPAAGSAADWTQWWETNRPYLFYSDVGSCRWCIDPLAKRRGIPNDKLQGPARATTTRPAE